MRLQSHHFLVRFGQGALLAIVLAPTLVHGQGRDAYRWDDAAHKELLSLGQSCLGSGFESEPTREEFEALRQSRLLALDSIITRYPATTTALAVILIKAMLECEREGLDRWDRANKLLEPLLTEDGVAAGRWQRAYAHRLLGGNLYGKALNGSRPPDEEGVRKAIEYTMSKLDLFRWAETRLDPDFEVTNGWGDPMDGPWNPNRRPTRLSGDVLVSVAYWMQDQAERLDGKGTGWHFGHSPGAKVILERVLHEYPSTDAALQAEFNLRHLRPNAQRDLEWSESVRRKGVDPAKMTAEERDASRKAWLKETQQRKK